MGYFENVRKPTKSEQLAAMKSYETLIAAITQLKSKHTEIEIEETKEKIKIPMTALKLLAEILRATGQGQPVSVVPIATEISTQAAAEFLGCSRPHLVKLLESGEIPFTKVGKHRRVKFEDVMKYKRALKKKQEALLIKMMKSDEESGLYDT